MLKFVLIVAVLFVLGTAGWQVAKSEVANSELQDDMRDLGATTTTPMGYSAVKSDDGYRAQVIRDADQCGIKLTPDEVTVQRSDDDDSGPVTLTANYTVIVKLPGYTFPLHFTPRSTRD